MLIVPYKHYKDWFVVEREVQLDMLTAIQETKKIVDVELHPDGYNIGMNCGETPGQTIMHCHVHIIPRYSGDMENPGGGVRGVIPGKQKY